MATIGAKGLVTLFHRSRKTSGNSLLTQRQMARALYQVLQKQIICPLFRIANLDLQAIELQPLLKTNIVIAWRNSHHDPQSRN